MNVDKSVEKWNKSPSKTALALSCRQKLRVFTVFHNFFNRIILSSFFENTSIRYTISIITVSIAKKNNKNFMSRPQLITSLTLLMPSSIIFTVY